MTLIKQKIFDKSIQRVTIQVKSPLNIGKSRSITIYNMSVDDVADRIRFMFETLEKNDGDTTVIKHYKYKEQKTHIINIKQNGDDENDNTI